QLTGVTVTDSLLGPVTLDKTTLAAGESATGQLTYTVTEADLPGPLANTATASANDPCGSTVTGSADASVDLTYSSAIEVVKTASLEGLCPGSDPLSVNIGDTVTYCFNVTNTGDVTLTGITVSDDIYGTVTLGTDTLAPGASTTGTITHVVVESDASSVTDTATATGTDPIGDTVTDTDPCTINVAIPSDLTVTKTADKTTAYRGEDITYNITVCAVGDTFTNVILWDVLPAGVELVSASPATSSSSSTLSWFVGTLGPGQCSEVTVVVRVPVVDINYDMEQGVQGEGFVNVHNDYDTHQGPESVTNCAYAKGNISNTDLIVQASSCATTAIVDPGTELKRRESGSGTYESDEVTAMRTENKSIHTAASLSAVYRPTTFNLPSGRSITYGSKWTDKSKAINTITGATMNEEYTHATSIDRDRSVDIDDNGTTMKTEVTFEGSGHIGVLKKEEPDSHPKVTPAYEATEDYVGRFNVTETADEYGSGVRSNKSVTGYGYTAVDKRVSDSQRTYESGTGSYESDEIIDTSVNYIAKDINLVHGPTSYSYTPDLTVSQDMKWNEGMWSKSGKLMGGELLAGNRSCPVRPVQTYDCNKSIPAVSYIGERYSSLDYLKKETEAIGLNEMNTNASFSGMAEYKVKATDTNRTGKIDNEELYVGQYGITRKVRLGGVSKYDRPHITVTKEGNLTEDHVAGYVIYIENDGTTTLSPVNIRDMLPPGTEYIYSSMRPSSLTDGEVSWSVPALGVGSSLEIELELNITEFAPDDIVNRVQVCGMDGIECISAAAYSAIESGALPCCPPEIFVDKTARLDASDPTLVHYAIVVKNNANSTIVATVTDRMPTGLTLLGASPEPNSLGGLLLQWVLLDIQPGEVRSIEYDARASIDGNYVNSVQVDATSVDGRGYKTAEAAAQVQVSTTAIAPRTTRYGGWQPPNWNMTSPDEGITIELSPDEDIVEG
ncbi:MAG TPA: hypothetical protein PLQ01_09765, partial [Methanothrix sp.]|nr:hypothetical protein [Methanothrix sp.]